MRRTIRQGRRGWSLRLVALTSVMALLLAACGNGDDGDGAADPGDTTTDAGDDGDNGEAEVDDSEGLVIDGEEIADAELWEQAQAEGGLTLYTALSELREIAVVEVFEEDTGLSVDIVRLGGGPLFERIASELGGNVLEADVIRQTDYALASELEELGAWEEWCPLNIDEIDEDLRFGGDENCAYYATMQPTYAIAYNTALVDEADAPQNWDDLLDEQWQGNICVAHIGSGGSTWARDLWLRDTKGIEYWEDLAAQNPQITGAAGQVTEELTRGECAVSMNLPGTVSLAIEEGAPLQIVFPSDGVVAYSQWTGLATGVQNEAAAKVFLNWHMSMKGQRAVAERAGDFPVVPGAPAPTLQAGEHGEVTAPEPGDPDLHFPEALPEYLDARDEYFDDWFRIFGYSPE
jgi:iron(III) transport system substrate-binding protein